mgnify:CR=1 FL=1
MCDAKADIARSFVEDAALANVSADELPADGVVTSGLTVCGGVGGRRGSHEDYDGIALKTRPNRRSRF